MLVYIHVQMYTEKHIGICMLHTCIYYIYIYIWHTCIYEDINGCDIILIILIIARK